MSCSMPRDSRDASRCRTRLDVYRAAGADLPVLALPGDVSVAEPTHRWALGGLAARSRDRLLRERLVEERGDLLTASVLPRPTTE